MDKGSEYDESKLNEQSFQEFYDKLDGVKVNTQALLIPFAIASTLIISYITLQTAGVSSSYMTESNFLSTLSNLVRPLLLVLPNLAVSFLFVRVELQYVFQFAKGRQIIGSIIAAMVVSMTYLYGANYVLWPLHNVVNMCFVITMSRLFQLPTFSSICLALGGLTIYDYVAVYGTQQFTDGGQSIMEAIATARLNLDKSAVVQDQLSTIPSAIQPNLSGLRAMYDTVVARLSSWRPGLFEVSTGGRVSDALGLADVLFPSILLAWTGRFDKYSNSTISTQQNAEGDRDEARNIAVTRPSSLHKSALFGFVLSCILSDVAALLVADGRGQPALTFIVPSMIISVLIGSLKENSFDRLWSYSDSNVSQSEVQ